MGRERGFHKKLAAAVNRVRRDEGQEELSEREVSYHYEKALDRLRKFLEKRGHNV